MAERHEAGTGTRVDDGDTDQLHADEVPSASRSEWTSVGAAFTPTAHQDGAAREAASSSGGWWDAG